MEYYTDSQLIQALSQAQETESMFLDIYLNDKSREHDYVVSMESTQILEDEARKRRLL